MRFLSIFIVILVISSAVGSERFKRLAGGLNAKENAFPYVVGIRIYLKDTEIPTWCGGSIINNEWILTAAHCTQAATSVEVLMGNPKISSHTIMHSVDKSKIIDHPKWNPLNMANDISLIKIPYTPYSPGIQPITFPSDKSYESSKTVFVGWGNPSAEENIIVDELKWGEFKVISQDDCIEAFPTIIMPSNICVLSGSSYTCGGDSGGPMVLKDSSVQIGVSTFTSGSGCTVDRPSVFTRVSSYIDWIKSHTK